MPGATRSSRPSDQIAPSARPSARLEESEPTPAVLVQEHQRRLAGMDRKLELLWDEKTAREGAAKVKSEQDSEAKKWEHRFWSLVIVLVGVATFLSTWIGFLLTHP